MDNNGGGKENLLAVSAPEQFQMFAWDLCSAGCAFTEDTSKEQEGWLTCSLGSVHTLFLTAHPVIALGRVSVRTNVLQHHFECVSYFLSFALKILARAFLKNEKTNQLLVLSLIPKGNIAGCSSSLSLNVKPAHQVRKVTGFALHAAASVQPLVLSTARSDPWAESGEIP